MKPWTQTILSQYNDSPRLTGLLAAINDWLSPDANLEAFYNDVFNIATAVGYGLDVWGRIVGVIRVLTVSGGDFFGFTGPGGASGEPYTQAPFYEGVQVTSNFTLTDDSFRQLILAKAAANITNGSVQAINAILMTILFPNRGNCFVADNLDMTLTYTFGFHLEPFEEAMVTNSGVLPTPVGVTALYSFRP